MLKLVEDNGATARCLSEAIAAANAQLLRTSASLGLAQATLWCECGDATCRERLTITAHQHTQLHEHRRPLIATKHTIAPLAPHEQTELERLRETVHQLQLALLSRVSIEQAKGVLAERHGFSPDDAFELLRRSARSQRRRLVDLCRDVVDSASEPPHDTVKPASMRRTTEPRAHQP